MFRRIRQFLKFFFLSPRHVITYTICGVLTVLLNYAIFWCCTELFGINYLISNTAAWVLSTLFAYTGNRILVFRASGGGFSGFMKQLCEFAIGRICSLLTETVLLRIFVGSVGWPKQPVKIAVTLLSIAINYLFARFLVFRHAQKTEKPAAENDSGEDTK